MWGKALALLEEMLENWLEPILVSIAANACAIAQE